MHASVAKVRRASCPYVTQAELPQGGVVSAGVSDGASLTVVSEHCWQEESATSPLESDELHAHARESRTKERGAVAWKEARIGR